MSNEPKTLGILPAKTGALAVLQFSPTAESQDFNYEGVREASLEVATYHAPKGSQAARHGTLTTALAAFLEDIIKSAPPGPERSTAISRAREAKMWASAAVALEDV